MLVNNHEELMKLHGRKCTCTIDGKVIIDAKISVDLIDREVFICHNSPCNEGTEAPNMLGYSYSWWISSEDDMYKPSNSCRNIVVEKDKVLIGEL